MKPRMRKLVGAFPAVVLTVALALFSPARAQSPAAHPAPKAQDWIQGRFVPVGKPNYKGDAEVVTILCSIRESECLEVDSESIFPHAEQAWIQEFKVVNWDKGGIMAAGRSLDRCTDESLKIRFAPPSVVLINSPVLPMTQSCRKFNDITDKIAGRKGFTLKGQMEQDMLVPTRGLLPFQDTDLK